MPVNIIGRYLLGGMLLLSGCASSTSNYQQPTPNDRRPFVARLNANGEMTGLKELNRVFSSSNEGYSVSFTPDLRQLKVHSAERLAFIQTAGTVENLNPGARSVQCGDILQIHADELVRSNTPIAAIVFEVPQRLNSGIPDLISPDNDPNITDTPGGCAEESDAYRRICLTWLESRGSYISHELNAHRVRITDSFTHFHPPVGGFDEFYLVQSTTQDAVLLTSTHADRIQSPEKVTKNEVARLLTQTKLMSGDLIYLPRGVVHRGLGGAVIHVVAVPGFKPNAEIGVDHHLAEISRRTGIELSLNQASKAAPKIK